jgi:hypothetical protein
MMIVTSLLPAALGPTGYFSSKGKACRREKQERASSPGCPGRTAIENRDYAWIRSISILLEDNIMRSYSQRQSFSQ